MKSIIVCFGLICSMVVWAGEQVPLSGDLPVRDQEFLLNLARQTLYWYLKDGTIPKPDQAVLDPILLQKHTCFVTLKKRVTGLRGCMGFEDKATLYETVIDRAIAAATKDPRFNRVKYDELDDIKIEISILTEPKALAFSSPADLLSKLRPKKDGVILHTRYGASTFLPQVWDDLPDKRAFLSHLCEKHGAPMNAWEDDYKNVKVDTYQAIVFGEEVYGRKVIGPKGAKVGKKGAVVIGAVTPLKEKNAVYGGGPLKEGDALAPGAIVTVDSDIIE